MGRKSQSLTRTIKEAINTRVNDPSLNRNIGNYRLSHVWDESYSTHYTSNLQTLHHNLVYLCAMCPHKVGGGTGQVYINWGRLISIKLVPHTGTRWHNICQIPIRFYTISSAHMVYHLSSYLCGTPSAIHHTALMPSALYTILVSITFSTELMKPCCFAWWKLVCTWKYFCLSEP